MNTSYLSSKSDEMEASLTSQQIAQNIANKFHFAPSVLREGTGIWDVFFFFFFLTVPHYAREGMGQGQAKYYEISYRFECIVFLIRGLHVCLNI